jgi:two-component system NtrC family sensor kinase
MFNTIRARIIAVFSLGVALLLVATTITYLSIYSLSNKLHIIESYDDLSNNILEVRRYEKNFVLYKDSLNLKESIAYLDKSRDLADTLATNISLIVGEDEFSRFRNILSDYRRLLSSYLVTNNNAMSSADVALVRSKGKELVDFVQKLISNKRQRIHKVLIRTLVIPFVFLLIFITAILLTFRIVVRDILQPLQLIQRTTRDIARGNFAPMEYNPKRKDEIYDLAAAFNTMVRELDASQEELVQSRKIAALGTFTAGVAHEINNPLNNIYLTAEALIEDFEREIPGEAKELVLDVLYQAERAAEVVGSLLDFSRSERPSFTELSIDDVVQGTVKLVKNQLMLTGISLTVEVPSEMPKIKGAKRHLQQVFLNLFLNAIHAMPNGGELIVRATPYSSDYNRVDVQDTGVGITAERLEKIFDPFYTTKGVGRGTGLGLSVTYGIVREHGGYIEVASEVGKGSTFSVFLPLAGDIPEVQNGSSHSPSG